MAAMYRVNFADGASVVVHSADAKSFKARDVKAALRKARLKAEAKQKRAGIAKPVAVDVRCIG